MRRHRHPYPPEFRRQMIELVRAGRTPEELAREFEPTAESIRNWIKQGEQDEGLRADGALDLGRGRICCVHGCGEPALAGGRRCAECDKAGRSVFRAWAKDAEFESRRAHAPDPSLAWEAWKLAREYEEPLPEWAGEYFDRCAEAVLRLVKDPPADAEKFGLRLRRLLGFAAPGGGKSLPHKQRVRRGFSRFLGQIVEHERFRPLFDDQPGKPLKVKDAVARAKARLEREYEFDDLTNWTLEEAYRQLRKERASRRVHP